MQCWARLPLAVFGPNVLSKGVGTDPIVTHFGPASAQIMPRSLEFSHRPMADRIIVRKLWQTDIIKMI